MSDATIRAALKTLLESVTGIGIVHDYSRWADDEVTFEDLYTDPDAGNQPLHGWEITREGFVTERLTAKYKVTHDYLLRGFYALKDSRGSEKLFNLVVDAVNQKLIDTKLANTEGKSLPKVRLAEWEIGDVLCHRAEVRMSIAEIWTKTAEEDQDLLTIKLGQYLAPGTDWAMWQPDTEYLLDAVVVPPEPNGRKYKCTVAGTSDAAVEPVWPVLAGGVIADGTAEWTEDGAVVAITSEITI